MYTVWAMPVAMQAPKLKNCLKGQCSKRKVIKRRAGPRGYVGLVNRYRLSKVSFGFYYGWIEGTQEADSLSSDPRSSLRGAISKLQTLSQSPLSVSRENITDRFNRQLLVLDTGLG